MDYLASYNTFKNIFNHTEETINVGSNNLIIHNIPFQSTNYIILPGEKEYRYNNDLIFNDIFNFDYNDVLPASQDILNIADSKVIENQTFTYSILRKSNIRKLKGVILFFHGLNEKSWNKYLPWAEYIAEKTGKAIVLFPLAFNINRVPEGWSDPRLMYNVSRERKRVFQYIAESTFANAAISTRFQEIPQRMFWSGLQSFYDIVQLTWQIRSGAHPLIDKDAGIDFFGYSVGATLGLTLLMSNPSQYFTRSKIMCFCGGVVFSRADAVSKFILDSEACAAVNTFYLENLENVLKKDKRLAYYLNDDHPIGSYFKCMLHYQKLKKCREEKISKLARQIFAIGLEKDYIIPPYEIINTLKGEKRKIPSKVRILDLPYAYDHENPFPTNPAIEKIVNTSFNRVFKYISDYLK